MRKASMIIKDTDKETLTYKLLALYIGDETCLPGRVCVKPDLTKLTFDVEGNEELLRDLVEQLIGDEC